MLVECKILIKYSANMKTFDLKFLDPKVRKDEAHFLDRISPSMVGVYLQCPLAFYYKFVAKLQIPEENLHLLFGTAVHKVMEEMYNGDPEPFHWFNDTFVKENLDPKSQERYAEFKYLGEDMVRNYLALQPRLDSIYLLSKGQSELRFRQVLLNPISGEPSRIPVSGVVDRYLAGNRVVEYKTSAKKWDKKETKFKVQSRLYSLWAYTQTGEIPSEVLYFVLLKQFKQSMNDKTLQVIRYQPTKEDLAEAWEELDTILEKIEHGHFERATQDHPPFCDCYKYEKALGLRY